MTISQAMTPEAFERAYAARSGVSVSELRALGRIVVPCWCDNEGCEGWQSISRSIWEEDAWYRMRNGGEGWVWPRNV